jgi:hypothetical protein
VPPDEDAPRNRASRALSHPAALLLLTAVLTGLLVPWVTTRWEAHDKAVESRRVATERELAAKTALVSRVGSASADFLSALEVGTIAAGGARATMAFEEMQNAAFEIASQLAAYFPNSRPEDRWRNYTYSLRNAYHLLAAPPGKARNDWLFKLNRYLGLAPTSLDGLCFPAANRFFAPDLRELVLRFQHRQEEVVRAITESPTVLTGTPTPDDSPREARGVFDPRAPNARTPCASYFGSPTS